MKIVLIGLGRQKGELSVNAYEKIKNAKAVFLRSAVPDSARIFEDCAIKTQSFDYLFEKTRSFDALNAKIAAAVVKYVKENKADDGYAVYCVDGSVAEDNAAAIILSKIKNAEVFEAASRSGFLAASSDIRGGYTAVSAYSAELINAAVTLPLLVYDIDGEFVAADLKIKLCDLFGDETPAVLLIGGKKINIKLYELDRFTGYSYDTVLMITRLELTQKTRFNFEDLLKILEILRSENGCPWDRAQTRDSISVNLIEECYELYDALKRGDATDITEEAGDVLLQVAFHVLFGEEAHEYDRGDVISGICEKLITRHTHVFGTDKANSGDGALAVWEKNKQKEKGFSTASEYLNSVPKNFPACMRAQKIQKRAAKYGFDFENVSQIYDKLSEEAAELKSAKTPEEVQKEAGDLLFTAINLARFSGADGEQALNLSSDKFLKRFKAAEQLALNDGKELKNLSAKEWDGYYNEAKNLEDRR